MYTHFHKYIIYNIEILYIYIKYKLYTYILTKQSLSLEFNSHTFGELSFGTWYTGLLLVIEIFVV